MEEYANNFSRTFQRARRKFNTFPSHKKVFLVAVLALALPLAVYLLGSFKLFTSRAASAQLSFSPAQTTLPPNKTVGVVVNSGAAGISFARVEISFDKTKVNLSDEIQITGPLKAVIGKTNRADANASGHVVVVVVLCNSIDIPCTPAPQAPSGTFELFKLPLTAISGQTGSTQLTYDISVSQLVDTAQANVVLSGTPGTITVGGSGATSTPGGNTPTVRQNSPTPRPTSSNPQAATTLSMSATNTSIGVNQTLPVNIQINTHTNEAIGVDLDITYDPAVINVQDIAAGSFFTNPDVTNKNIDNTTGHAKITIVTPPSTSAKSGTGTLAIVTFKGISLSFSNTSVDFGSDTVVAAVNLNGQNALSSSTGIDLTVTDEFILGDIDQDGDVDIVDYVILFANFGKNANDQGADARADINNDGRINSLDYTYVFENFGRTS